MAILIILLILIVCCFANCFPFSFSYCCCMFLTVVDDKVDLSSPRKNRPFGSCDGDVICEQVRPTTDSGIPILHTSDSAQSLHVCTSTLSCCHLWQKPSQPRITCRTCGKPISKYLTRVMDL